MSDDLATWLLAAIAEDERIAGANSLPFWPGETLQKVAESKTHYAWQPHDVSPQRIAHILRFGPARVLAECDAKRQIIDLFRDSEARLAACPPDQLPSIAGERNALDDVLRRMASAYAKAGRPGYREEWAPT